MHGETIKKKDVESVSCHVFRGGIIPQNSLLLHTCTILCVNYSCLNLDWNALVWLQLVLLMQARPFALQVEPTMFQRCLLSETSFVWPFDSTCLWSALFLSRIKPVAQNLFGYLKFCFRLWNCWGSIPIATDWPNDYRRDNFCVMWVRWLFESARFNAVK